MARNFVKLSTQYLYVNATPVTAAPLTLTVWVRPSVVTGGALALFVGDKDSGSEWFRVGRNGTSLLAQARSTLADSQFGATGTLVVGTWTLLGAVFTSNVARTGYFNATAGTTPTTDVTPLNADRIAIGVLGRSSLADYWDGDIAEAAVWDYALAAGDFTALAAGDSPMAFATPPVRYWRFKEDVLTDEIEGTTLTNVNTTYTTEHPTVDDPPATGDAPALRVMSSPLRW